jgi:hypothetical protein
VNTRKSTGWFLVCSSSCVTLAARVAPDHRSVGSIQGRYRSDDVGQSSVRPLIHGRVHVGASYLDSTARIE